MRVIFHRHETRITISRHNANENILTPRKKSELVEFGLIKHTSSFSRDKPTCLISKMFSRTRFVQLCKKKVRFNDFLDGDLGNVDQCKKCKENTREL